MCFLYHISYFLYFLQFYHEIQFLLLHLKRLFLALSTLGQIIWIYLTCISIKTYYHFKKPHNWAGAGKRLFDWSLCLVNFFNPIIYLLITLLSKIHYRRFQDQFRDTFQSERPTLMFQTSRITRQMSWPKISPNVNIINNIKEAQHFRFYSRVIFILCYI